MKPVRVGLVVLAFLVGLGVQWDLVLVEAPRKHLAVGLRLCIALSLPFALRWPVVKEPKLLRAVRAALALGPGAVPESRK